MGSFKKGTGPGKTGKGGDKTKGAIASPGPAPAPYDLELECWGFRKLVGLGWQLPADAPVQLCVGESYTVWDAEAHYEPTSLTKRDIEKEQTGGTSAVSDASRRNQHLAVRAGMWGWYPRVRFLRWCVNYPGLCVPLGDLRDVWVKIENAVKAAAAKAKGPQPAEMPAFIPAAPVKIRFGPSSMVVAFRDAEWTVGQTESSAAVPATSPAKRLKLDLNEFNKLLGALWRDREDSVETVTVYGDGEDAHGYKRGDLTWLDVDGDELARRADQFAKVRVSWSGDLVCMTVPIRRLREVCREMTSAAAQLPGGLRAFETVEVSFSGNGMTLTCCGQSWQVEGKLLERM